jgi:hypothetical protein
LGEDDMALTLPICPAFVIALFSCATIADVHAGEIWRDDWFLSAPPTLARTNTNGLGRHFRRWIRRR